MSTAHRLREEFTLEEFLRRPEIDRRPYLQYIDGRAVPKMSPKRKHSFLAEGFCDALNAHATPARLGKASPELRCTFGGRSIIPDVTFHLAAHIEVDDDGEVLDDALSPPDIHVEIISPDQSTRDADEALRFSTSHGCPLGWLVHPYRRAIDVYRPGRAPERLADDGVLEGEPVLPGFRLPVAEVWGWLRLPRLGGGGA